MVRTVRKSFLQFPPQAVGKPDVAIGHRYILFGDAFPGVTMTLFDVLRRRIPGPAASTYTEVATVAVVLVAAKYRARRILVERLLHLLDPLLPDGRVGEAAFGVLRRRIAVACAIRLKCEIIRMLFVVLLPPVHGRMAARCG